MRRRAPIERPEDSRRFTDDALDELRAGRWSPRAWARFTLGCCVRSCEQVHAHRRAALEVTALHLALLPLARRRPLTLLAGWLMAVTHLGLLGPDVQSIGPATALSLARAQLPPSTAAPLSAMASDVADGWLARRTQVTAFGAYADALADVTFWTRFGLDCGGRLPAVLALAAWAIPAAAITTAYFARGRTIDYPRPLWMRCLSAALQCAIAATTLVRLNRSREG
jgi:phosphatidylglycerophosphate synthase